MAPGDLNRIEGAFAEAAVDCGLRSRASSTTRRIATALAWLASSVPVMCVAQCCSVQTPAGSLAPARHRTSVRRVVSMSIQGT